MEKLIVNWCLRALIGPAQLSCPHLRYSKTARGFALFSLAVVAAITLAVVLQRSPLRAGEGKELAVGALIFAALAAILVIEFFGVGHEYDGTGITYRSPWSSARRVAWAEVARIEWRPILKWLDVVPVDDSKRLHLHPMIGGLAPFAKLALQQIPSRAWADQPEAYIALRLMASGHHAKLTVDARKPSQLAADPDLQLSA